MEDRGETDVPPALATEPKRRRVRRKPAAALDDVADEAVASEVSEPLNTQEPEPELVEPEAVVVEAAAEIAPAPVPEPVAPPPAPKPVRAMVPPPEDDPAQITAPPAKPKRGWWRL